MDNSDPLIQKARDAYFPKTQIGPIDAYYPKPKSAPLFERRVTATLKRCTDTFRERGDQYGDTWADCQWLKLRAILFTMWGTKPTATQCRAMALACFADMKYQRLQGGYTPDHIIDGINYDAALAEEMEAVYRMDK